MFQNNNNFYSKANIWKIFIFFVFFVFILVITIYNFFDNRLIKQQIEDVNKNSSLKLEKPNLDKELYSQTQKVIEQLSTKENLELLSSSTGEAFESNIQKVLKDFEKLEKHNEANKQDEANKLIFQKIKDQLEDEQKVMVHIVNNLLECCEVLERKKRLFLEEIKLGLTQKKSDVDIEKIISRLNDDQIEIKKGRAYLKNLADILNLSLIIIPQLNESSNDADPYNKFLLTKITNEIGNNLSFLQKINNQIIRNNDSLPRIFRNIILSNIQEHR